MPLLECSSGKTVSNKDCNNRPIKQTYLTQDSLKYKLYTVRCRFHRINNFMKDFLLVVTTLGWGREWGQKAWDYMGNSKSFYTSLPFPPAHSPSAQRQQHASASIPVAAWGMVAVTILDGVTVRSTTPVSSMHPYLYFKHLQMPSEQNPSVPQTELLPALAFPLQGSAGHSSRKILTPRVKMP